MYAFTRSLPGQRRCWCWANFSGGCPSGPPCRAKPALGDCRAGRSGNYCGRRRGDPDQSPTTDPARAGRPGSTGRQGRTRRSGLLPGGPQLADQCRSGPYHRRVSLHLYDTATRSVRPFEPLRPGVVSLYNCGATVQWHPHIGHLRGAGVVYDVLRRWLEFSGYEVLHVRNVTDIDDKILAKAAEAGRPWWEWATTHERSFYDAYDALGLPAAVDRAAGDGPYPADHRDDRRPDRQGSRLCGGRRRLFRRAHPAGLRISVRPADRRNGAGRDRGRRQAGFRPTSPCGRRRNRASRPGPRRGGRAARAGTSNARRWPGPISARRSTSTAAGWI